MYEDDVTEENATIAGKPIARFWVEATAQYYPAGGMDDIKGRFPTREEAEAFAKTLTGYDDVQIVDVLPLLIGET